MSRSPRTGPWVALLLLGLLMMAGAAGAYVMVRKSSSAAPPVAVTFDKPPTVAGLKLTTNPELIKWAADLDKSMIDPAITSSITAFYEDPAAPAKNVVVTAHAVVIDEPSTKLDELVLLLTAMNVKPDSIANVDAGPMGGAAKCGAGTLAETPFIACVGPTAAVLA